MSFNPSTIFHFFRASRDNSTAKSFKYFAGRNLNVRLSFLFLKILQPFELFECVRVCSARGWISTFQEFLLRENDSSSLKDQMLVTNIND